MAELRDVVDGRPGEWMQTFSGRKFFPLDPRPEDIYVSDIANALAMTCRYGGHMPTGRFYSVAEHSVLMFRHGLAASQNMIEIEYEHNSQIYAHAAVVALFHDAAEAYTGDLPRAVKQAVKESWAPVEARIEAAVWTHLQLEKEVVLHWEMVKEWDQRIVPAERAAFMRREEVWAYDVLEPLPVNIRCLAPISAKHAFVLAYWEACTIMGWDPEEIEL